MDTKDLMHELADRIGQAANVKAVFGEPVGQGQNVIIPVARMIVRGGGGGGKGVSSKHELHERGMGMGLNISTVPVGYIRQTQAGAVFVPILDKNRLMLAGMGVAALGLWVVKVALKMKHK